MRILANEIDSVEILGTMDGHEIKMIRTKGGLHLAIGVDGKGNESVMGAASHPAILCYNIEKANPSFHPSMMKSEKLIQDKADKHSHFLSDDLRKSGHDIYSVQNGPNIDFYITMQDIKVATAHATVMGDSLIIKSANIAKEFYESFAGAVGEKSLSIGLKQVQLLVK
jgi:hypothetical protein